VDCSLLQIFNLVKKGGQAKKINRINDFSFKGGEMKKLIPLFIILAVSMVFAVDMNGKMGVGAGWMVGSSTFAPNVVILKCGLGEKLVLEPVLNFSFSSIGDGTSTSNYNFDIQALFAYAIKANEKANFYAKAGISFGMEKTPKITSFGIPLGLGLEYFISDNFSVDLNHVMGFGYTKYDEGKTMNFTITTTALNVGLVWYYQK
jgi:opacity protein-like surface antigen